MEVREVVHEQERGKIPIVPRHIPLAVRRAEAERKTALPREHDAQVRQNNARAIESAG